MTEEKPDSLEGVIVGFTERNPETCEIDLVLRLDDNCYVGATFYTHGSTKQIYYNKVLRIGQRVRLSNLSTSCDGYHEFMVLMDPEDKT